mgnify:CR=1 FL=1
MYCLSVSHKTSNVVVRKKLAFPDEQKKTFLDELYYSENISECLILCTCNRTEVYFCGDESSVKTVETVLSDFSGIDFDELKKYICLFYGDRALLHLFRVAGGIESMVIGEDEILGQLKRAYAFAKDNGTVAYELNMCVQAAVACAKKIKTETAISKTSVSVATLASNEAAKFKDGELNVLVIGATGKVGSTVVKNLLSHKSISVTVTSRKHKAETVFENTGANVIDYDKRYKAFDFADCVISATSGPHYTVTYYDLKNNIKTEKSRLFIDLAVPPDIDENIPKISGVRLINIDCIKQLAVVAVCAVRVRRIDRVQRVGFGVVPDGQVPDLVAGLRQVFTGFLCAPVKAIFRCAGANLVALILIPCISSIDVPHPPRSILHSLHAGRQNAVFLHRIMQHDLGLCPVYTVL